MVIPALVLATATSVALPPGLPGTQWHAAAGAGYPVESGRPAVAAHEAHRPATHVDRGPHAWYVLVRPQHRRLRPATVPAQPRILRPGLLLHSASQRQGAWIRCYDPQGKSWVNVANVRPAQEPRGWDTLVVKIHPALRHVRTVSHLPLPPASVAPRAAVVSAAAPVATPAPTVAPHVVQVVQVVQPAARTPVQSIYYWAGVYGVNGDSLLRTAQCESGLNAGAYNASGASGGLQFMPATFASYAGQLTWDHAPSYWNFDDSARVAAYMWSQGQENQWVCYGMVG